MIEHGQQFVIISKVLLPPKFQEVFDDMYDSGNPAIRAHTAHFDDPDFYQELALHINNAKIAQWNRKTFIFMSNFF